MLFFFAVGARVRVWVSNYIVPGVHEAVASIPRFFLGYMK